MICIALSPQSWTLQEVIEMTQRLSRVLEINMDKLITCAALDKKAPRKGQEHLTQNWIVWLQCFEMVLSADRDLG